LISDVAAVVARHDPAAWVRPLRYRPKAELPYDPAAIPPDAPLLLDTTVYIDQLKGHLPPAIVALISSHGIVHGAPVLAELAVTVGVLDPRDPRTATTLEPILDTLRHIPSQRIIAPSEDAWLEGAVLAGILARTQSIVKEYRRKFLNDALMFLLAAEADAILISRNARDIDLLLQIRPDVGVLLYERSSVAHEQRGRP
jgi:predicted nucleic acid-binding protein